MIGDDRFCRDCAHAQPPCADNKQLWICMFPGYLDRVTGEAPERRPTCHGLRVGGPNVTVNTCGANGQHWTAAEARG